MNDVKIIFMDLDGTLKNSDGKITDRTYKAMENLKKQGIYIVFTTGRSIPYTKMLAKSYNPSNYIISSNGAEIYNYVNDTLLFNSPIDKDSINYINELIEKYNLIFIANTKDNRYSNKIEGTPGRKLVNKLTEVNEEINQVVIQSNDINNMKLFRRDLNENDKIKISNKSTNFDGRSYLFYDVTNSNVSKGNAIVKLCEHLKIDMSKTMALGDSGNDIEMFNVCHYKVAMANAEEDLKKVANLETLSNDQEGVALVLERLYQEIIM